MGSRFSRTEHEHKAAASPRVATSHESQRENISRRGQDAHCQAQTDIETNATTSSSTRDSPACNSTSSEDIDAMDVDQPLRRSSLSRSASNLQDLEQLPFGVVKDAPLPIPQTLPDCLICCTPCDAPGKTPIKAIQPCRKCENTYCVPCLKNMFTDACKDLSRMPPRCCLQIPIHHIRPYLTPDEATLFRDKYEEWGTPNPFYCPVARCSAFIPTHLFPSARANDKGKQRVDSCVGTPTSPTVNCPKCEVGICTKCRGPSHAGAACNIFDFGVDEETADLLQAWGYKKCPKCGTGVKRMYGCSHMQCRCGANFCWGCLQGRNTCLGDCGDDDDDDDDDDEEYDQSEPDEEEDEENAPVVPAPPASSLAHVFPYMLQTGEATVSPTAPDAALDAPDIQQLESSVTDPSLSSTRIRNLDGGSGHYWANQDLDFGDEPTDHYQDTSWSCSHDFYTAKTSTRDPANHMECMKCWATIHPEVQSPPDSVKASKPKTTTGVASTGRETGFARWQRTGLLPHTQIRAEGSLRGTRSIERFEAVVAAASPLGTSPASCPGATSPFSSLAPRSQEPSQDGATACGVDVDGDTVATAKETAGARADDDVPAWGSVGDSKGGLGSATGSAAFSFAYECHWCGLLVCHRCKDSCKGSHRHREGDEDEEANQDTDEEETRDSDTDGHADEDNEYAPEVDTNEESENARLWM